MITRLFQRNSKQGAFRTYILKNKTLKVLGLSLYSWKFFIPQNSVKLCYTLWKFQGQKPRLKKTQHNFFLIFHGKINLRIADQSEDSSFESSSVQLRSNKDLERPECSNYY